MQLYVRDLACPESARPVQELRGRERIALGESREVQFALDDRVLGYVGRDDRWRVDPVALDIGIVPHAGLEAAPARYEKD